MPAADDSIGQLKCDCGCGELFSPNRPHQRFKTYDHKKRYWAGVYRKRREEAAAIEALKARVATIEKRIGIS